jgi:hypothetical protein
LKQKKQMILIEGKKEKRCGRCARGRGRKFGFSEDKVSKGSFTLQTVTVGVVHSERLEKWAAGQGGGGGG